MVSIVPTPFHRRVGVASTTGGMISIGMGTPATSARALERIARLDQQIGGVDDCPPEIAQSAIARLFCADEVAPAQVRIRSVRSVMSRHAYGC